MKSGIYKIENIINKKYYIGQSEDLEKRIKEHKYLMSKLKENNKKLNNDIAKYGIDFITNDIYDEEYNKTRK